MLAMERTDETFPGFGVQTVHNELHVTQQADSAVLPVPHAIQRLLEI